MKTLRTHMREHGLEEGDISTFLHCVALTPGEMEVLTRAHERRESRSNIALQLGVTPERVGQLHRSAYAKIADWKQKTPPLGDSHEPK